MVRVLTVDDHAPFREVAHELVLATPGFEPVGEVATGEEALAAIQSRDPDLVLVDVHMPGMSGIEVARQMKSSGGRPVVVLISARALVELPAETRCCGAAEVISKQDLGPARLRELWQAHGPNGGAEEP